MEQEQVKKSFYKRKMFVIPAVLTLSMVLVAAAVFIATINVDVTINEAISTEVVSLSPSGFPGEEICDDILIQNDASVDLEASLNWTETSNLNGVIYSTNLPATEVLVSGNNSVEVCFLIDNSSPVGTFEGDVTIERI